MVNSVNNSSAVSQVDAPKASTHLSNKFKSVFSKAVSTLAQALLIPQIISKAGSNKIARFAALTTALALGPLPTLFILDSMRSVKKLCARLANKHEMLERQPLLAGQEKSL